MLFRSGDNDDSHNHNDTGSFTIYKKGQPLFVDIGVESYTKKTFSSQRYEIWAMQSDYHNLPTLNGTMQKDGNQYKATHITTQFTPQVASISLDLSTAYPNQGGLLGYQRTTTLFKEDHILIEDYITSDNASDTIILNLITYEAPTVEGQFLKIGDLGTLELVGDSSATESNIQIEVLPITDARLQIAWKHDLYRIRIHLKGRRIRLKIS